MKPTLATLYGHYNTDGSGYACGHAIAFYPIAAAAEAQIKDCYQIVRSQKVLKFEDVIYAYSEVIPKERISGLAPAFTPFKAFRDYSYVNGFDKTKYYIGDNTLLELLADKQNHAVAMVDMIRDDEDGYYLLSFTEPVTVAKFTESREIAIAHALSKLSAEERKLLGLEK